MSVDDIRRAFYRDDEVEPSHKPTGEIPGAYGCLYRKILGKHVHCRLFVGQGSLSGNLVFRDNEWPWVEAMFKLGGFRIFEDNIDGGDITDR